MAEYRPLPLVSVAEQFAKLPGIGMKTAQRLAYFMLNRPEDEVREFAEEIVKARESVHFCRVCQNFTEREVCSVCDDDRRDPTVICVVEAPKDVSALERAGGFSGVYHVLHGLLSPMDGVGPNELRIAELMTRLSGDVSEVIMATSPTVEGEATASYLSRLIKPMGVKVTRLAYGLPAGAALEYADDVTLQRAMENRNEL
ncbi:MAG: recombination mediator RecR [Bacteroides sp.]|nr:recombination mediator RecR [Eubacterium sp.]MCM1419096.1 recombination mediator RecR [Roseburia sp.]MCM1462958.1 recombination mediator RecR [Bacteroides sp.]